MLFALLLSLSVVPAQAKNFAFVLAGSGRQESLGVHDFIMPSAAASLCLKSAGYEVRTLVGAENPLTAPHDNASVFPEDYGFLREQKIPYTPATVSNIRGQLSALVAEVKAERASGRPVNVELVLNTHGNSLCEQEPGAKPPSLSGLLHGGGALSLPEKTCRQQIEVFDGQSITRIDTKIFRSYIEEMERAGAHVNLNLNSCNAGAARKDFDSLPGVCTFYGSVDQTLATGCSKGIPGDVEGEWWNSNTYVNMFRSCAGKFDELLAPKFKGYFSGNGCFMGLKKHIEEKGIDLSSVASAYFSERKESTSFEASVLSCFDIDFVSKAGMAGALQKKTSVCAAREDLQIEKLLGHLSDALLAEAWGNFDRAMDAYNDNLDKQHEILPESSEDFVRDHLSRVEAEKLARLETEGEKLAAAMIAAERALFERYYELEPAAFDGCQQGACGVKR